MERSDACHAKFILQNSGVSWYPSVGRLPERRPCVVSQGDDTKAECAHLGGNLIRGSSVASVLAVGSTERTDLGAFDYLNRICAVGRFVSTGTFRFRRHWEGNE